jgi:hypothetical protein
MQNKTISVNYTPFAQMMANGLTKALSSTKWETFLNQMELSDGRAAINSENADGGVV